MRTYRRLRVDLKKRDRDELDRVLNGGIQPVRVVLRSLTLCQLHDGKSTSEVAANVQLTSKAVREIGRRYEESGLERALYDKQRPGAQSLLDTKQRQRVIAMVCSDPPEGRFPPEPSERPHAQCLFAKPPPSARPILQGVIVRLFWVARPLEPESARQG